MKYMIYFRELTVSELLSIAIVFVAPIVLAYSILN